MLTLSLIGEHFGHFEEHTFPVDTCQSDGCIEEYLSVHIPFGIEDTVTITGFEDIGPVAFALMYLDGAVVENESQYIVARDGMAAIGEAQLMNRHLVDDDWHFLVELRTDVEESVNDFSGYF